MIEPIEALRASLLSNEEVLKAIQMRAYEIWILRGRQYGRDHEDWMLAENEILNYLIEQEMRRGAESVIEEPASLVLVDEVVEIVATPLDITPEPIPEADVIIEATAPVEVSESKPTRKRASTKATATTRKPKVAKETAEKKAAAKKTATTKKPATRRTASKKSAKPEQPVVE